MPANFQYNNITLNGGELRNASNGGSLYLSANRGILLGSAGGVLRAGWSNTTTVAGVINGGGLTIADDGQGFSPNSNVYLANTANTYTGSTTIGGGSLPGTYNYEGISTLTVAYLPNGGQNSPIGASSNAASNLVFNSYNNPTYTGTARLNYAGTGDSTDRLFTIASGVVSQINNYGTGPLNFTNPGAIVVTNTLASTLALGGTYAGPTANTFAPAVTDNGALPTTVAVNGSLWTLTGGSKNSFTGGAVLNGGTLNVTGNGQLQNNTVVANGGSLTFAAGVTSPILGGLAGNGGPIALQDANSNPVTLNVGANNKNTAFAGSLSGPGGLSKTGIGMLQINGSQVYAGATVVNGGTLQIAPAALSGFGGNGTGWTLKETGNPAVGVSNNVLTLTQSNVGSTATALWYNAPVSVTGPWTAAFTYNNSGGSGADGTCFVVQNAGLTALGAGGGDQGFSGISPSFGMSLRIYTSSDIGFYTSPASGTNIDNGDTTPLGSVNLRAANSPVNFTLSYNGNGTLLVSASQGANVFTTTTSVNTASALGNPAGGLAYIGFTGADGGTDSTQLISNFTMTVSPGADVNLLPANTPLRVNAGSTFDLYGGTQAVGSLAGAARSPAATAAAPPC